MTLQKSSGCNAAHLKFSILEETLGDDFMQLFIFGSTNAFYNAVFATLATFMYGVFLKYHVYSS